MSLLLTLSYRENLTDTQLKHYAKALLVEMANLHIIKSCAADMKLYVVANQAKKELHFIFDLWPSSEEKTTSSMTDYFANQVIAVIIRCKLGAIFKLARSSVNQHKISRQAIILEFNSRTLNHNSYGEPGFVFTFAYANEVKPEVMQTHIERILRLFNESLTNDSLIFKFKNHIIPLFPFKALGIEGRSFSLGIEMKCENLVVQEDFNVRLTEQMRQFLKKGVPDVPIYISQQQYCPSLKMAARYRPTLNQSVIDFLLEKSEKKITVPERFECQITTQLMDFPYKLEGLIDGHIDVAVMHRFLGTRQVNPYTRKPITENSFQLNEKLAEEIKIFIMKQLLIKYRLANSSNENLLKGLRRAALRGHVPTLTFFLKHADDCSTPDDRTKMTALHCATKKNRPSCALLLAFNGARLDVVDHNQKTPLDYAGKSLQLSMKKVHAQWAGICRSIVSESIFSDKLKSTDADVKNKISALVMSYL